MLLRLFCLLILLVPCVGWAAQPLLVVDVNGYSLDGEGALQRFDALLVENGRVAATGSRQQLQARAPDARVHEGGGRTLLPGLIDAHGHVMGLGMGERRVDLSATASLQQALDAVRRHAAQSSEGWVLGRGWNQVRWNLPRFPTAAELDQVEAHRPVWLVRVDGHAGWANSAALQAAGIDRDTPDPAGGRIERDAHGEPSGILIDAAMALVTQQLPAPDAREREAMLDAALASIARVGITSVHDAGIDVATFQLYRKRAEEGRLSARIYAMVDGVGEDFDRISASGPLLAHGNDMLTVRSVKLFSDGALGSRGAALLAPYSDDPDNQGLLFHATGDLAGMIGKALARGFQVNVHAIGDGGNRQVLDAFSLAYRKHGGRELRNRVEHAQVVERADRARFLPLRLIASMQPIHATSDMNMAQDRLGAERVHDAYAWQAFLEQGTVVVAGSDFPVEAPDPFHGLHAAVTRQDQRGQPAQGWYPAQRLTLPQALRAFTLDAAYAAHQEDRLGTLEPGKWADFILVDRDIFSIPPEQLWQVQVEETWVAGQRVFAR